MYVGATPQIMIDTTPTDLSARYDRCAIRT
jgi:hypothetical protein